MNYYQTEMNIDIFKISTNFKHPEKNPIYINSKQRLSQVNEPYLEICKNQKYYDNEECEQYYRDIIIDTRKSIKFIEGKSNMAKYEKNHSNFN